MAKPKLARSSLVSLWADFLAQLQFSCSADLDVLQLEFHFVDETFEWLMLRALRKLSWLTLRADSQFEAEIDKLWTHNIIELLMVFTIN